MTYAIALTELVRCFLYGYLIGSGHRFFDDPA